VDQAARYLQLVRQGRDTFLSSAAPAALVRRRDEQTGEWTGVGRHRRTATELAMSESDETQVAGQAPPRWGSGPGGDIEVYPLSKKPGASFPDMITIGRTANNDIVLKDVTISRFHVFFRQRDGGWFVGDAGSKNGTLVDGDALEPRKERVVASGCNVRIGDLELTFYTADQLFELLSG
jgi:hypothetical protein